MIIRWRCGLEVPSDVFRQSGPVALAGVSDAEHCLAGGGAAGQPRPGSVVVTVTACGTARGQYTDWKNRCENTLSEHRTLIRQ